MNESDDADASPALTSVRTMEVVVALLMLMGSAVVIMDCLRLGFGWASDGPAPGFFPFWIAVILAGASLANLVGALGNRRSGDAVFVTRTAFARVLAVLVPTFFYLLAIGGVSFGPVSLPGLGLYIASGVFIAGFMLTIGRERPLKAVLIGVGVPIAMYWLFEKWFLVPLPKGPFGFF